jgi:hypothetical protein
MTITRNDQIKSAIVAKLKANTTITAQLKDTNEIREAQWQADNFTYPNIRVRVIDNNPTLANCNLSTIRIGIGVFSEQDSSQEADKIAGIIANELHTQSFTSLTIKLSLMVENLKGAIRTDDRTWMSEVIMNGTANG